MHRLAVEPICSEAVNGPEALAGFPFMLGPARGGEAPAEPCGGVAPDAARVRGLAKSVRCSALPQLRFVFGSGVSSSPCA